tara:strand:+ start:838 stop:1428 length:591 start_codon:yes stop_codon:yes gene_type:complete
MNTSNIDYVGDANAHVTDLNEINEMANRLQDLEAEVEQIEKNLKNKKAELRNLSELDLPEALASIGQSSWDLSDGKQLVVKDFVRANIPADGTIERAKGDRQGILRQQKDDALNWLREAKADSLIKNAVEIQFGKGQDAVVNELFKELEVSGLSPKRTVNVHPKTLEAFVKERLADGKFVPIDLLNVHEGKKTVIK